MPNDPNTPEVTTQDPANKPGAANNQDPAAGAANPGKSKEEQTKKIAQITKRAVTRHTDEIKQKLADRGIDVSDFSDESLDALATKLGTKKPVTKTPEKDGNQPDANEVINNYIVQSEIEKEMSSLQFVNDKAAKQAPTLFNALYQVKKTKQGIRVYQDGKIVTDDEENPLTVKQAVERFATDNPHLLDGKGRGGVTGSRARGLPNPNTFDFNDMIRAKVGR